MNEQLFFDKYSLDEKGTVLNTKGKKRKYFIDKDGYYKITMRNKEKFIHFYIHRLLAIKFIPNPENKPFINHKNGSRSDNRIENLEWCTQKENVKHGFIMGRKMPFGEKSPVHKLAEVDVVNIKIQLNNGVTLLELATKYNVCTSTINNIKKSRKWVAVLKKYAALINSKS